MTFLRKNIKYLLFASLFTQSLHAAYAPLLLHGNCTTCHKISENKTAPSIIQIKENYYRAYPLKKDFIKYMSVWVKNPKEETSIMFDSIEKFGIMPNLAYDLNTLEEIAEYIYITKFPHK